MPLGVKFLTGVPWEIDDVDHVLRARPGSEPTPPSVRKPRVRKTPKDLHLGTIAERGGSDGPKSPPVQPSQRMDASTSTTDLHDLERDGPRRVPKGQVTALGKMLVALRLQH